VASVFTLVRFSKVSETLALSSHTAQIITVSEMFL